MRSSPAGCRISARAMSRPAKMQTSPIACMSFVNDIPYASFDLGLSRHPPLPSDSDSIPQGLANGVACNPQGVNHGSNGLPLRRAVMGRIDDPTSLHDLSSCL